MKIGVLALQGAVTEHIVSIEKAGAEGLPIKRVEQLDEVQGLIIPGGESTTIGKLMRKYGFIEAIRDFAGLGKPIFGTCLKHDCTGEENHAAVSPDISN